MRTFQPGWTVEGIVKWLLIQAAKGSIDMRHGDAYNAMYSEASKGYQAETGAHVILTRDTGHHACGWWKNPDYERCLHLSLSFFDPKSRERRGQDREQAAEWVEAVFHSARRLVWTEPPCSEAGKKADVWHYRVFYADEAFRIPILPRGEVYSKELTEAGWLSWSDFHDEQAKEETAFVERVMNAE